MAVSRQSGTKIWTPDSWRAEGFLAKHQPKYPDLDAVKRVEKELSESAGLVTPHEIQTLRELLEKVANGKAVLIIGGPCAESFDVRQETAERDVCLLTQARLHFTQRTGFPAYGIWRGAGQHTKPRSKEFEAPDIYSYFGDGVNDRAFNKEARTPDPERMLRSYAHSLSVSHAARRFAEGEDGGLLNLINRRMVPEDGPYSKEYDKFIKHVRKAISFVSAAGIVNTNSREMRETLPLFAHEGLLLPYEQAMTRQDKNELYYDLSSHMLWIGERTRMLNSAHVEFFRGVQNPIGVKVGPTTNPNELVQIIKILNPDNIPGKVTLFSRMGVDVITQRLPALILETKAAGLSVIWACDPMHGNGITVDDNIKTRRFDDIVQETMQFMDVCRETKTFAGAFHVEITSRENTAEVLDEIIGVCDLQRALCDAQMNAAQTMRYTGTTAKQFKKIWTPS